MNDWTTIEYLKKGNERQKNCYQILKKHSILEILAEYEPIVVGTFPLEIDIPSSDIDIICYAHNSGIFKDVIIKNFSLYKSFTDKTNDKNYVAKFTIDNIPIEVYAEPIHTLLQYGYRHMVIESRILNIAGDIFKEKIIQLKEKGLKTEPAFGKLLKLDEPYYELLYLEKLTDAELQSFIYERYVN